MAVAAGESSPSVRVAGVSRDSPIPLHFQLRALLLSMVERGEVRHDRPLPPERQLAAQFGVSLAPVRQAILDLVKEGVLYRVRGKGTFLRERRLFEQDAILSSFSENMRAKGLKVEMRILRSELYAPPRVVREALETAERRVWLIQRLALVEDEPTALLTSNLSRARFPDLAPKLTAHGSLNRVLEDEFGISPRRADFTVEVGRCTSGQSSVLQVPVGSSVLVASGTTYGVDELPVEHFQAIYRSDRIRLRLDTYRYLESVVPYARRQRRPPKVRKVES